MAAQAGVGRGGGLLALASCGCGGELARQDHAERLHRTLIAHGGGGAGKRAPTLATTALLLAVRRSPTFSPPIPPPDLAKVLQASLFGASTPAVHLATIAGSADGALLGSLLTHGVNPELAILSDDAGQFNVLHHALCWIHAERVLAKLVGFNDEQRAALEKVRTALWELYRDLKAYKTAPTAKARSTLEKRFDGLCATRTCFTSLNLALKRMSKNKSELLLVLKRPDLPLHNNLSEGDIREYVKRRKISGGTRSDEGRRGRDTFASLKKTCRKLGVSFWNYLKDRIRGDKRIPFVRKRIQTPTPPVLEKLPFALHQSGHNRPFGGPRVRASYVFSGRVLSGLVSWRRHRRSPDTRTRSSTRFGRRALRG